MSHLWSIAQRHLDAYGVRAAALARRMGTSPQTLDSWKNRGVRRLPEQHLLKALARETRTPYGEVLTAALRDAGYLPSEERESRGNTAPITRARDDSGRPGMTAARWDRAAAALRADPLFPASEADVRAVLGPRPGEVSPPAPDMPAGGGMSRDVSPNSA